ncbi:MAG: hypothetical protein H0W90_10875 [Actinobacteria bacterium]|nr:hypothetical protein [Actinomycetota bacterium]
MVGGALPSPLDVLEERLREIMKFDSWKSREDRAHEAGRQSGLRQALYLLDQVRREQEEIAAEHVPGRVYGRAEPERVRPHDFAADDRPAPRYESE